MSKPRVPTGHPGKHAGVATVVLRALLLLYSVSFVLLADQAIAAKEPAYLFTYFHRNGEDGLHMAYSRDGYKWTALKNDESFLKPAVGSKLMRDPCVLQGPDGTFHLVWSSGWWDKGFGYASSKNLIDWSPQRYIPINENVPKAQNTWAPELFYDRHRKRFLIVWSTSVPGRFPETDHDGEQNHRQYYVTTKNFHAFSQPKLFFNPGFNCVDGIILEVENRYHLIFKDERPGKKVLKISVADHPEGPYGPPSGPIARDWVEGPSVLKIKDEWFVYFDHYRSPQFYGAVKSSDLKHWEDVTDKMSFPRDFRHGTVIQISEDILQPLLQLD